MQKIIVAGGPGVGKTSLIEHIAKQGFPVVTECARPLIDQEQEKENGILPWTDIVAFQRLIIQEQIRKEQEVTAERSFGDRSLGDIPGYLSGTGFNMDDELKPLIKEARYTKVFLLEQLASYEIDNERKETKEEADALHKAINEAYEYFGFSIDANIRIKEMKKLI